MKTRLLAARKGLQTLGRFLTPVRKAQLKEPPNPAAAGGNTEDVSGDGGVDQGAPHEAGHGAAAAPGGNEREGGVSVGMPSLKIPARKRKRGGRGSDGRER